MDATLTGIGMYLVGLLTMGGLYAILALGLNVHWGFTGLFNAGIAGFFAIGAYTNAILTTLPRGNRIVGFDLPIPLGMVAAMVVTGLVAWGVGLLCLRLKSDYLAIATIGIAEILRLLLQNEAWLTNGSLAVQAIPRPFESLPQPYPQFAFLALVLAVLAGLYLVLQRAYVSPWGRVLRAIRDSEAATSAAGKDVVRFRLEAFVLGGMIMGLGGAMMAQYTKIIGPDATEPLMTTFLVWVMLIIGGSGNNKGAILGAIVVWAIWSMTAIVTAQLPPAWGVRLSYLRVFLIGLILQIVLQRFARGLVPEHPPIVPRARTARDPADG